MKDRLTFRRWYVLMIEQRLAAMKRMYRRIDDSRQEGFVKLVLG